MNTIWVNEDYILHMNQLIRKESIKEISLSEEKRSIIKYKTVIIINQKNDNTEINIPVKQETIFYAYLKSINH